MGQIAGQGGPARREDIFSPPESGRRNPGQVLAICGLLVLAIGLVFGQTVCHQFVNYDDNEFLYENPHVSPGLTGSGIAWALTHFEGHYWIPLTRISSMLDCQLYGLKAGGHHLTNVLLHAATTILLFLIFWRMSGGLWPSALVAALFAVHPLHVESVAWVTERKDVLSGLFFVLALAAYVWYVRSPRSLGRYLLLVTVFVLGLMTKPMLVTLPLVLLLLDYWPLGRMAFAAGEAAPTVAGGRSSRFSFPLRVVLEKVPLLAMTAVFCVLTSSAMHETVVAPEHLSLSSRWATPWFPTWSICTSSFARRDWPCFIRTRQLHLPLGKVIGAAAVLAGVSAAALAFRRRCPYLLMGWLWYLGMLMPVIGVVQLGWHARADRFTYLPQIGLYMALAWGAADACRSWPYRRWACGVTSVLVLAILMGCAWRQTCFWRDSETLWTHALACTSQNCLAHNSLGMALDSQGRSDEAMAQYQKALEIKPNYIHALNNLGVAFARLNRLDEAMAQYQKAVQLQPDYVEAHYNLGNALAKRGRMDEARAHYQQAVDIKPDYLKAHYNLGGVLAARGRLDEAVAHYRQALDLATQYHNRALAEASRAKIARYETGNSLPPPRPTSAPLPPTP